MGEKMLMKGNEAIAEAAIQAGCRFFFGYPITPQNQIPRLKAAVSCRRRAKWPPSIWSTARPAPERGL